MTDRKSFARGLASQFRIKGVIKYIDYTRLISDQRIHLLTNKLREIVSCEYAFHLPKSNSAQQQQKRFGFLHLVCSVYSREKSHSWKTFRSLASSETQTTKWKPLLSTPGLLFFQLRGLKIKLLPSLRPNQWKDTGKRDDAARFLWFARWRTVYCTYAFPSKWSLSAGITWSLQLLFPEKRPLQVVKQERGQIVQVPCQPCNLCLVRNGNTNRAIFLFIAPLWYKLQPSASSAPANFSFAQDSFTNL